MLLPSCCRCQIIGFRAGPTAHHSQQKIRSQTCDCLEDDHECPGSSDDDDDDGDDDDDDDDDDKDEDGDCDVYGLLCRWSS